MRLFDNEDWIKSATGNNSLICVTDGSFMKKIVQDWCSAEFILECKDNRGRIVGLFSEASRIADAYRGELLGLMAIHLILLSTSKVRPRLKVKMKSTQTAWALCRRSHPCLRTECLADAGTRMC